MNRIIILLGAFALLNYLRCGTSLLVRPDSEYLQESAPDETTHLEFYSHTEKSQADRSRIITTHLILHVGTDGVVEPDVASTYDGEWAQLLEYEARVRHPDGSFESFDKGDLHAVNNSRSNEITNFDSRAPTRLPSLRSGDKLEVITVHHFLLAGLGVSFSLSRVRHPAKMVTCRIEFPPGLPLPLEVSDGGQTPEISGGPASGFYEIVWRDYHPPHTRSNPGMMTPIGDVLMPDPSIILVRTTEPPTWKDFGDWYLHLIDDRLSSSSSQRKLAEEITSRWGTDREKMDAIFRYCQTAIRYTQLYLERGEFIPNDPETILEHRYGDCKDYSVLMYALARSIGLEPNLALCYRGRQSAIVGEAPVSQFNHMILHFTDGDSTLWYDGTNRVGLPGVTTMDLANVQALVLQPGNSHLERIPEIPSNLLEIKGVVSAADRDLSGSLQIVLRDQYAIDFYIWDLHVNRGRMRDHLIEWLRHTLSDRLVVDSLSWKKGHREFLIDIECRLPQSLVRVPPSTYVSGERLFDNLLVRMPSQGASDRPFYYPGYSCVSIDIELKNLAASHAESVESAGPVHFTAAFAFPSGPFTSGEEAVFSERYAQARAAWLSPRRYFIRD